MHAHVVHTRMRRVSLCAVATLVAWSAIAGFSPAAHADIRKADLIAGQTVEARNLSAASCPDIDAARAIVVDAEGKVYFERDADEQCNVASITKVMTAITALDAVSLDTEVVISENAAYIGESSADVYVGDVLTLEEALKAMLIPSGNDGAQAIAESIGAVMLENEGLDSDDTDACAKRFVSAMNDKANEIGLTNTVWTNPHGLDYDEFASEAHSTARDVATMCAYAMKNDTFRSIVSKGSASFTVKRDGEKIQVDAESTDELIGQYDGACGIKTGYTELAGSCFAGASNRGGKDLYAIVLGCSDNQVRFTDVENLWDWTYEHTIDYPLCTTDDNTYSAVAGHNVPYVADVADAAWIEKTVKATIENPDETIPVFDLEGNISQTAEYREITGDVKAGDVVGTITYKQHNDVIATASLVATEDVPAPGIFEGIGIWWNKLIGGLMGDDCTADSTLYNKTPLVNDKSSSNAA